MRSARLAAKMAASPSPSTSTTTPSTNVTPAFSSISAADTPVTSDNEDDEILVPKKGKRQPNTLTRAAAKGKRKSRPETSDSEQDNGEEASASGKSATKRRATENRAYVEIIQKLKKGPAGKQSAPRSLKRQPPKPTAKKAAAPSDDEELASGSDGLEYNSLLDDDSSGSEFQVSSGEEEEQEDSGDDEMMEEAIQMSRQTSRSDTANGASSSSTPARGPTAASRMRAAAAERRLSRNNGREVVDDSAMVIDEDESSASESDEEPLAKKKGKGKAAKGKAPAPTKPKKAMTMTELREERKAQRKRLQDVKNFTKQEEKELRKKLGRKLTYAEKSGIKLKKHHPELNEVWGDLEAKLPVPVPVQDPQPTRVKLTLLPFQLESLNWMKKQEKTIWHGGMLADEMGMGKTIQIISLLVSEDAKPNLVIAPTVAVMQWKSEIETHTDGLKVLLWHGQSRESDVKELLKYDVVLSTYAVVESSFRKQQTGFKRKGALVKQKSPIHQITWNRIILDEAHNIKERSTNTAKATFELKALKRWCLSGTPLQNRVGELYSLIRFLGGDPFSYYFCKQCSCKSLHWKFSDKKTCDDCGHSPMAHTCFWNNEILTPIQKHGMEGPGQYAFKKLRILLDRMMLRRTKIQKADDLGLPPRTVIVRNDYFSPEEKELYLSLFSDAKRKFNNYVDSGTILNNYSNIFSLLTRMRQMACHPDLVLRSKTNATQFVEDTGEATVCRICHDIAEDAIQSKCRHIFDRECIKQYLNTAIEQQPACPVCHLPLTIDLEAPALEIEENASSARQGILGRLDLDTWRSSTKIEALVEELSNLRAEDSTTKSLVFSQFVNFLDLIAFRLKKAGFNVCRLEGTMSPAARDATIKHFMNNVEVTVFLVSLKAGGVALNLTEASRVYLMDSWWNPAVEFQAMDRIHRLGQHRPVKAIKLVVEDSIESRIVQLQEKKSAMVDATLSTDDSAMGRLTPEDLGFLFKL